jgi:hypothetical protein
VVASEEEEAEEDIEKPWIGLEIEEMEYLNREGSFEKKEADLEETADDR